MEKQFYTIGEVSEILGENNATVRFWSNSFPRFVQPSRSRTGYRIYRKEDIETLRLIRYLIRNERLTVEGAAKRMTEDRKGAEKKRKVVDSLNSIRGMLEEVAKNI